MPKHFASEQRGKHFSQADPRQEDDGETRPEEGQVAPTTPETPSEAEGDAEDTRPMSPDEFPDPIETGPAAGTPDERTTLLESLPSPDGPSTAPAPEQPAAPSPATPPTPDVEPEGEASPEEPPATLGRHEVAAVQADDELYMRSEPSPYLSNRQAAQDPRKARHRHSVLIAVALVVLGLGAVGGAAYYIYNAMRPTIQTPDVQFETDKITRGNFTDTIDATSTLSPASTADVVPQMTGTVTQLSVEDGSTVKKGQTLFVLDNPTVKAATTSAKEQLDDAQSDLDEKDEQLKEAQDELDSLEETLTDSASKVYSIVGKTPDATTFNVDTNDDGTPDALDANGDGKADGYDTNGDGIVDMVDTNGDGTPDQFDSNGDGKVDATTDLPSTLTDEQRSELASAETAYQNALKRVDSAQSAVEAATAADKASKDNVSNLQDAYDSALAQERKLTVTAPISGTVHDVSPSLTEGASITTTSKLCEVDDVSQLVFTIQASQAKASKTKVGMSVSLTFPDASDLTATGRVTSVATTTTDGTDTYAIGVALDNADGRLDSGDTATASILLQEIDDVLMVPSKAITTSGSDSYVDVLLDPVRGIDTQVQVSVVADNGETAVVEGDSIQEGNSVVLSKTTSD